MLSTAIETGLPESSYSGLRNCGYVFLKSSVKGMVATTLCLSFQGGGIKDAEEGMYHLSAGQDALSDHLVVHSMIWDRGTT